LSSIGARLFGRGTRGGGRKANRKIAREAIECLDAPLAVRRAQYMMREKKTVGSVAFSRRSNAQTTKLKRRIS
jgi:hypothetical protein